MADTPQDEVLERLIKLQETAYDSGARYTNIIIAGGYGAFFGLWSLSRDYLSRNQGRLAAIYMLVSGVCFVGFEVYKMTLLAIRISAFDKLIFRDPDIVGDANKLIEKLRERDRITLRHHVTFARAWIVALSICVTFALLAVGVLLFALITGLFAIY